MTIDALKALGVNTAEGLGRCLNREDFYLRMVGLALGDGNFDKLKTAMEAGDSAQAFEAAHALKGAIGNVSLTPIYRPISELTEALRGNGDCASGMPLFHEAMEQLEKLRALL